MGLTCIFFLLFLTHTQYTHLYTRLSLCLFYHQHKYCEYVLCTSLSDLHHLYRCQKKKYRMKKKKKEIIYNLRYTMSHTHTRQLFFQLNDERVPPLTPADHFSTLPRRPSSSRVTLQRMCHRRFILFYTSIRVQVHARDNHSKIITIYEYLQRTYVLYS